MIKNILSAEERKIAVIAANNFFMNSMKLCLLYRIITKKENFLRKQIELLISNHVKHLTNEKYFKNPVTFVNFISKLFNKIKQLRAI
ncbi:MAG: hypothetical protein H0W50_08460 [Parachlamydiaceae bacterium]|nr:hypothetical protein [Parachlamydiaceae bacterium]